MCTCSTSKTNAIYIANNVSSIDRFFIFGTTKLIGILAIANREIYFGLFAKKEEEEKKLCAKRAIYTRICTYQNEILMAHKN